LLTFTLLTTNPYRKDSINPFRHAERRRSTKKKIHKMENSKKLQQAPTKVATKNMLKKVGNSGGKK